MIDRPDDHPFPVMAEQTRDSTGRVVHLPATTVPWWLASEAYEHYREVSGNPQPLERIAERGGSGRWEILALLRRRVLDHPDLRPSKGRASRDGEAGTGGAGRGSGVTGAGGAMNLHMEYTQ